MLVTSKIALVAVPVALRINAMANGIAATMASMECHSGHQDVTTG
jgi:hypothetical protein